MRCKMVGTFHFAHARITLKWKNLIACTRAHFIIIFLFFCFLSFSFNSILFRLNGTWWLASLSCKMIQNLKKSVVVFLSLLSFVQSFVRCFSVKWRCPRKRNEVHRRTVRISQFENHQHFTCIRWTIMFVTLETKKTRDKRKRIKKTKHKKKNFVHLTQTIWNTMSVHLR